MCLRPPQDEADKQPSACPLDSFPARYAVDRDELSLDRLLYSARPRGSGDERRLVMVVRTQIHLALVLGLKLDHELRRLRLVRFKARRISIVPVRHADDFAHASISRLIGIEWFQDVKSMAIEEECVFPEQPCQLRHRGVIRGHLLGFKL